MILDDDIECPLCSTKTKLVDDVTCDGKVLLRVCTRCSAKQLGTFFAGMGKLLQDITAAVDRHCPTCHGDGWRALNGQGKRTQFCPKCSGTGIDLAALLEALDIQEKPKPAKHASEGGFSPGVSIRNGSHRGGGT